MGKKLGFIFFWIFAFAGHDAYAEQTVEWKDTSASTKLDLFLGFNRAYRCYMDGRKSFDFTVGPFAIARYEKSKRDLNENERASPPAEGAIGFGYQTMEKGKRVGQLIHDWAILDYIDPPPNQIGNTAKITLGDGRTLTFELFAPTPEWPFTTKERLKPYFYMYSNGKKLKCGGRIQLD